MPKAYLAGPTEDLEEVYEHGWRAKLTPRLLKLGIEVLDPTHNCGAEKYRDWREREHDMLRARRIHDWEFLNKCAEEMWEMIQEGLAQADFVIAHTAIKGSIRARRHGTVREMHVANESKKRIYLVVEGDPSFVSIHMLHMALSKGKIFASFDELVDFLRQNYV